MGHHAAKRARGNWWKAIIIIWGSKGAGVLATLTMRPCSLRAMREYVSPNLLKSLPAGIFDKLTGLTTL